MLILWSRDLGRPVVQLLKIFGVSYGYGRFITVSITSRHRTVIPWSRFNEKLIVAQLAVTV
jgi:hypothetical protein